jgi:hypothetical protein
MNNLYGTAMTQPLPRDNFRFLSDEELQKFDFTTVSYDSPTGYILEVDLEYPAELHDSHSDYPLCPESVVISNEDLSPYTRSLADKLGLSSGHCRKLVADLHNKQRYSVHYRNLQLYVRLGMKVVKIHRVLAFNQSKWLKPYIDFNTEQRKKAKNDFEKNFFKLMNTPFLAKPWRTYESIKT